MKLILKGGEMKKYCGFLLVAVLFLFGIISSANATLIFDFDQYYNQGTATFVDTASWGTMTIKDNATAVDLSIDLAANYTIDVFWLNYDPTAANPNFSLTNFLEPINYSANNRAADGYAGRFDASFGALGGPFSYSSGFSETLSATGVDLDPSLFDYLDTLNNVYSIIRIGNVALSSGPGVLGTGSAWIAASTAIASVPEPSIILLLGTGILGIAAIGRKKIKRK